MTGIACADLWQETACNCMCILFDAYFCRNSAFLYCFSMIGTLVENNKDEWYET